LDELGVEIKGKIAIMRYGGPFRGLKVKNAEQFGAVGAIIYSDPGDDGNITAANGYDHYPSM
jgi:N-acetylated-alpha-linked acidic dipeptidase